MSIKVYDRVDFCNLYINPLLDRLETSGLGLKIGNISVSNTSCADEIVLISEIPDEAQTLVNMATDFTFMKDTNFNQLKRIRHTTASRPYKWEVTICL
jgi:hypothetical protein